MPGRHREQGRRSRVGTTRTGRRWWWRLSPLSTWNRSSRDTLYTGWRLRRGRGCCGCGSGHLLPDVRRPRGRHGVDVGAVPPGTGSTKSKWRNEISFCTLGSLLLLQKCPFISSQWSPFPLSIPSPSSLPKPSRPVFPPSSFVPNSHFSLSLSALSSLPFSSLLLFLRK